MKEVFRKYGDGGAGAAHVESIACVVRHPDAGGQCEREAVGEVWSLPFCEIHGREAELAYMAEASESVGVELEALFDAERKRHDANRPLIEALDSATKPVEVDFRAHEPAMLEAYPPDDLESNTDPDTLSFDYERYGRDTPHDWWCESREMVARFMRQASDRGVPIVEDLEYLRERATVQELLANRDLDRRWEAAKTEA